jgi:hypothetical protein
LPGWHPNHQLQQCGELAHLSAVYGGLRPISKRNNGKSLDLYGTYWNITIMPLDHDWTKAKMGSSAPLVQWDVLKILENHREFSMGKLPLK